MTSYLAAIAIIVPVSKIRALVIGGGGREHAIAWKLAQSPLIERVYAAPGNPGIAQVGDCVTGVLDYVELAEQIDAALTVVGPEAPLVAGVVDQFRARLPQRKIIGPTAAAAQLEGSKAFSKAFMLRAGIPTARAVTAADAVEARGYLDEIGYPVVLKADGLAAGKGVIIAGDRTEAMEALGKLPAGQIVVEEFLTGEEVSFIVVADHDRAWPLEATQDHKAIFDDDRGPNTGGMGAYCDGRILTAAQSAGIMRLVIEPALAQMIAEGTPYTGFLYAGLMLTPAGVKVLEFNARLGDPETQALMHRMDSDFAATLLDGAPVRWKPDPSVCVVIAAHGYPGSVRVGDAIRGLDAVSDGITVFHAGTRAGAQGGIETAGGRVLGVTASGATLGAAIENTYRGVRAIDFAGAQYRHDIGVKGLRRW
jgi:phosphoribosylamine--glycine ligase